MKKYLAMVALSLAIAGTVNAQNATPSEKRNTYQNQDNHDRKIIDHKDGFRKNKQGRANITPEQRATQRTEKIGKNLDLSSKQKRQLQALNLKQAQQIEAYRNGSQQSDKSKTLQRLEMKQVQAEWEMEFRKILSKKQFAKYEEERKQMQAQRSNRAGKENNREAGFRRRSNS